MADNNTIPHDATNGPIAWAALIIAAIAMMLALWNYFAFSQLRSDLLIVTENTLQSEQENFDTMRVTFITQARELNENSTAQEIEDTLNNWRQQIAQATENAGEAGQEQLMALDQDLQNIQQGVRKGSIDALEAIQNWADNLEKDLEHGRN